MSLVTILFIAVSLAMDAFAVSVSNGISVRDFNLRSAVRQGVFFGGFQFIMPLIGWFLGSSVKSYIEAVDHWIAFLLLAVIGVNMIVETIKEKKAEDPNVCLIHLSVKKLAVQAVATSIDALAVGIGLAVLEVDIVQASVVIGIIAFLFSFFGGVLGKRLGSVFRQSAGVFGGVILIGIGLKILVEHLFGI